MATLQHTATPVKPPKKRPIPRVPSSALVVDKPIWVIRQTDAPILWVSKGDLVEVSKRVKENINGTWKVRAVSNTPRPGSLMSQAAVSSWIQPEIHQTDTLEGVIRR